MTGQEHGQTTLEGLDQANLFVVSLDDERQWYRYHHLFADVLRSRLEQAQPALVPELHRRAYAWYEQHEFFAEAIQHALAAPDFDHAAHLIEQHALSLTSRRQMYTVHGWLNILPDILVSTASALASALSAHLFSKNQPLPSLHSP